MSWDGEGLRLRFFCPAPFQARVIGTPGRIMEDHRRPFMDSERGNLPDPVAEAVRLVLRKQDRLDERLRILQNASGIASPRDELQEKTMIETPFSQGGRI